MHVKGKRDVICPSRTFARCKGSRAPSAAISETRPAKVMATRKAVLNLRRNRGGLFSGRNWSEDRKSKTRGRSHLGKRSHQDGFTCLTAWKKCTMSLCVAHLVSETAEIANTWLVRVDKLRPISMPFCRKSSTGQISSKSTENTRVTAKSWNWPHTLCVCIYVDSFLVHIRVSTTLEGHPAATNLPLSRARPWDISGLGPDGRSALELEGPRIAEGWSVAECLLWGRFKLYS